MKKTIAILLALGMLLSLSACGASKPAPTEEPVTVVTVSPPPEETAEAEAAEAAEVQPTETANQSGVCGNGLGWSFGGGTLTIRGQGPMEDYEMLTTPWDQAGLSFRVEKLVVGEGVTYLGSNAFSACCNLSDVSLPATLTGIGSFAFADCVALRSIALPEALLHIDASAFSGSGLESLVLPPNTASLGELAFNLCGALTDVTLPDSLIQLGEGAFADCDTLQAVRLNHGSAADEAMLAAGYEAVIVYGGDAAPARSLRWGGQTGELEWQVTGGVLSVSGSGDMPDYTVSGGDAAPWSVLRGVIDAVTLGEGVTSVGNNAFWDCEGLTEAQLAEGVTRIGERAFGACQALEAAALPSTVTELGDGAFSFCSSLRELQLPEGLLTIGEDAFRGCSALESLAVPGSVTSIGGGAFDCADEGQPGPEITAPEGSYAASWLAGNN